jgi:hypothetical protein
MKHRTAATTSLTALILVVSLRAAVGQLASSEVAVITTVKVDAKYPWVDSGLIVRKEERLSFQADGTIQWGSKSDEVTGPEGHGAKAGKLGKGGLIGRVGYSGKPFPIGSTRTPIAMPKSGKLFLGINDFIFSDNAGSFAVAISRSVTRERH